jgi:hypothetical protein
MVSHYSTNGLDLAPQSQQSPGSSALSRSFEKPQRQYTKHRIEGMVHDRFNEVLLVSPPMALRALLYKVRSIVALQQKCRVVEERNLQSWCQRQFASGSEAAVDSSVPGISIVRIWWHFCPLCFRIPTGQDLSCPTFHFPGLSRTVEPNGYVASVRVVDTHTSLNPPLQSDSFVRSMASQLADQDTWKLCRAQADNTNTSTFWHGWLLQYICKLQSR